MAMSRVKPMEEPREAHTEFVCNYKSLVLFDLRGCRTQTDIVLIWIFEELAKLGLAEIFPTSLSDSVQVCAHCKECGWPEAVLEDWA